MKARLLLAALPLLLAACATTGTAGKPGKPEPEPVAVHPPARKVSPYAPAQEDPSKRGNYVAGGLYAPGVADSVPDEIPDVDAIPEPIPRAEPRAATGNRSYSVLGKRYQVLDAADGYVETGGASYYGKKFHGRRTSSGEVYDMYAFTAAHRSLPLPSFARVTNLDNGKSVVVRVNDRGPFHSDRIIDLSYAAAVKLGYREKGVARVEVRALDPEGEEPRVLARTDAQPQAETALPSTAPAFVSAPAPGTAMDALVRDLPSSAPAPATAVPLPEAPVAPVGDAVTLQVASFIDAARAESALAKLRGAAIDGARLLDADVGGRKVWRLRIGPVDAARAVELAARIEGLGFAQPQRVRD